MSYLPVALQPPDPSVIMRPVQLKDIDGLHRLCWPDRSHETLHELVARAEKLAVWGTGLGVVIVGNEGNQIWGYGQFTLWPRCGEISDLIIAPPHRCQGLGTSLVQYLMHIARERRVPCVEIGAALSNPGALTLYRRIGFHDSHVIKLDLGQGLEPVQYLSLSLQNSVNFVSKL